MRISSCKQLMDLITAGVYQAYNAWKADKAKREKDSSMVDKADENTDPKMKGDDPTRKVVSEMLVGRSDNARVVVM